MEICSQAGNRRRVLAASSDGPAKGWLDSHLGQALPLGTRLPQAGQRSSVTLDDSTAVLTYLPGRLACGSGTRPAGYYFGCSRGNHETKSPVKPIATTRKWSFLPERRGGQMSDDLKRRCLGASPAGTFWHIC